MFLMCLSSFFCSDTPTTEIYTLSLHDALPISEVAWSKTSAGPLVKIASRCGSVFAHRRNSASLVLCTSTSSSTTTMYLVNRSEEHTSELQSLTNIVCRLLLEKKKQKNFQTVGA